MLELDTRSSIDLKQCSNTCAFLPIVEDLKSQKAILRSYLLKYAIFLALILVFDQLLGNFFRNGMDRYFGLNVPARVLCVGHSHTVLGVDKIVLENRLRTPVAIYARQGANASNRLAMIRHYLEAQPNSVKVIVYDVDAHAFTVSGLSANSHQLFYPFMDSGVVKDYVKTHAASRHEYWVRKCMKLSRFDEVTLNLSIRGWLKKWTNLKRGTVDTEKFKKQLREGDFRPIAFDREQIELFEETIRFVRSRGIHLVLAYIPTIDILNDAEPGKYREAIERFERYAATDNGVSFFNYNPEFSHCHDLFYDPIHMNPKGRQIVTERLAVGLIPLIQRIDRNENTSRP